MERLEGSDVEGNWERWEANVLERWEGWEGSKPEGGKSERAVS